jgi:hypothetical protein
MRNRTTTTHKPPPPKRKKKPAVSKVAATHPRASNPSPGSRANPDQSIPRYGSRIGPSNAEKLVDPIARAALSFALPGGALGGAQQTTREGVADPRVTPKANISGALGAAAKAALAKKDHTTKTPKPPARSDGSPSGSLKNPLPSPSSKPIVKKKPFMSVAEYAKLRKLAMTTVSKQPKAERQKIVAARKKLTQVRTRLAKAGYGSVEKKTVVSKKGVKKKLVIGHGIEKALKAAK